MKKEWKRFTIQNNNVKFSTEKATLIKMPNNSEYKGFVFWHPSKIVKSGYYNGALDILFTDDFVFHLKKYGSGRFNQREVLEQVDITAEDMVLIFKDVSDNFDSEEVVDLVHIPEPVEPVEIEADKDLLDE